MKKLVSLLLALVMCASLAACGGEEEDTPETKEPGGGTVSDPAEPSGGDASELDRQPAFDALKEAKVPLDELVAKLNENAESIEDEDLEIINGLAETIDEILEVMPDTITQEELDEAFALADNVYQNIDDYNAKYGEILGS